MKIILCSITTRRAPLGGPAAELVALYTGRSARYAACEHRAFASEAKLLAFVDEAAARTRPWLLLADSSGRQLSSPELAAEVSRAFDSGVQLLVFAVGPADGWSSAALARAGLVVAFGRITLAHELALVVAAEQMYRALTIRAGHPYHSGH